jgi:glutamate synthase domain-containing protein 1
MKFTDQFHNACSMGILAHRKTQPGHLLLESSIHALTRMMNVPYDSNN